MYQFSPVLAIDAPINVGLIVLFGFLALLVLRVPLFLALYVPSIIYLFLNDTPLFRAAQQSVSTLNEFTLLAVPLFIYVGTLMEHTGIADEIIEFANDLIGHISGGLAHVNIGASLIFSGMSGSALADVGSIGKIMIPQMTSRGYENSYAAAVTSASATTGPIFPPSIPLIVLGLLAQLSILQLFIAGIVPALLITLALVVTTAILARKNDFPRSDRVSKRQVISSFISAFPFLTIPVVLIGGMLSGYFGPTEIAGVTVAYMILLGAVFLDHRTVLSDVWSASKESVWINARILVIVPGAVLFNWVLTLERTAVMIGELVLSLSTNPLIVLLLIIIFLLILGLFLDPLAALIVAYPLIAPLISEIGMNPIHAGVVIVFTLMIGLLTPPVGLSLYLSTDIADARLEDVMKQMAPYYAALFISLLVVAYFEPLTMWLVNFV